MHTQVFLAAVAAASAAAQAGVFQQTIGFGEHPVGTLLDGVSIGAASFEFVPAGESALIPRISDVPINGGNFGATDNIVAQGAPDGSSALRLSLAEGLVLDEMWFAISTLPFSPAPFTATVGLLDAQGQVFETRSFSTSILVNLANGLPLLRYGMHGWDLTGTAEPVHGLEFVFSGNGTHWLMDNVGFAGREIPAPGTGAAALAACGMLTAARRRHTEA